MRQPYLVLNMEDSICFSNKNLKTLRKCLENYDGFCKLDEKSIKELTWWANNLNSSNKIDMPNSKFIVFSDAFPSRWDAAYENHSTRVTDQRKNHSHILI